MTPEAKRALKKQGKHVAAQRSAVLHAALAQANPAPVGSDEWMRNHLTARSNEAWLAEAQRDHIPASEVAKRFVLLSSEESGRDEPFAECLGCHDVLYTAPKNPVSCSCGSLRIRYAKPLRLKAGAGVRGVQLIAKGNT